MNRAYFVVVAGIAVLGVWHFNLALQAIFVFRTGEPVASWIAVLAGPASTLPAALFALLSRRGGGSWLAIGAVVSFCAFAVDERGMTENTLQFLLRITVPMVVASVVVLCVPRIEKA